MALTGIGLSASLAAAAPGAYFSQVEAIYQAVLGRSTDSDQANQAYWSDRIVIGISVMTTDGRPAVRGAPA